MLGTFFVRFEQMNPKNQKFLKTFVPIARYSIAKYCPPFFSNNEIDESVGNLFCFFEQMNPKNQKFLKTDVPVARYSIAKYCPPLFFKQRDRRTSVFKNFWFFGFICSRRTKKVKNTFVSPAIQLQSIAPLYFSNNEIDESVENLFCASRADESKKPKIFKNGRSYRPLFNCKVLPPFFFKQRDRRKCWEPFLCVSSR